MKRARWTPTASVAGLLVFGPASPGAAAPPQPAATDAPDVPDATPAAEADAVLLMLERGRPDGLLPRSESSIRAHLSAQEVDVQTEAIPWPEDPAVTARVLLERSGALAVFWSRPAAQDSAELFMVRAGDERRYRRRLPSLQPERLADQDAVALIVQAVVVAIRAGRAPGMDVVRSRPTAPPEPVAAPPPPLPPPPPPPRGRARIAIAYAGGTFARTHRWQHGVGLRAGWVFPFGLHLSAGYTWRPSLVVARDYGEVELRRHPIVAAVGGHLAIGSRVHLDADVPVTVERGIRISRARSDAQGAGRRGFTSVGIGLQGRAAVTVAWRLAVFAGAGLEVWPRTVAIAAEVPEREILVDPTRVRLDLRAGLEMRL